MKLNFARVQGVGEEEIWSVDKLAESTGNCSLLT